ncbi:MAG: ATP-dependent DNA helicase PcrA [Bacteroidetes bacterium ADurb.Bin123]|nr:MAG: ATP-dependent DNA helicase PcrA [Bacteroidetes bacterium ADurb.Bin123]
MMERIGNLVKQYNVQPETIIGLTFNRNAAEQMRQRLVPVLGELAQRVTLSTIHSWCHYLLRTEGKLFEIISGKEQINMIRNLMKRKRLDLSVGTILSEISLAKNNLIGVEEFRALYESDKTMIKVANIYESYEKEKAKKYLLDFDDLLLETYFLLNDNDAIREKYAGRYHHILIDEFQDTNPVQLEIIKLIVDTDNDHDKSYWIAGDDWQSIYSFAGASVNNILNFQSTFSSSRLFILNINYRSTPQILKACQNLISHNVRKIEKTLKTDNPEGDEVIVLESSSEEGEALCLVNEINDLVGQRGYQYKDIAVLYRANFQSRVVEETFAQMKIPYYIENGLNFYQRSEVRYLLDYLRLINDPDSEEGDEALKSILNVPNRYISRKFLQELAEFSNKTNVHLFEGLKSMPVDLPYIRKNVKDFISFISPLADYSPNLEPSEVISMIRSQLDYDRFITDEDIPTPDDVKIQNLNQLQLSAARYSSITSFLEYTDGFSEQMSNDKEGIALMTIHKAKGLEFPVVFVIGLVEGITPTKKGDIEEERRIVFVAISRAMRILYISHSHTYMGQASRKSLFIDEIMGTQQHSIIAA